LKYAKGGEIDEKFEIQYVEPNGRVMRTEHFENLEQAENFIKNDEFIRAWAKYPNMPKKYIESKKYSHLIGIGGKPDIEMLDYYRANGGEFAKGGDLNRWSNSGMDEIIQRQKVVTEQVRFAFAKVLGLDKAYKLLLKDSEGISPYRFVEKAVSSDLLLINEIDENVINSAIEESEDSRKYSEQGQGIGSSDIARMMQYMLNGAGLKTEFVNSKLERVDNNGNVIHLKNELPKSTMFSEGGEVDKKKYKFEIAEYKNNDAVLNDEPTNSDYEGTKEKVIDFQYQRMQRGYCVYFNITIIANSNNEGWFYESEDLYDLIDKIENSNDDDFDDENEYAKGGETKKFVYSIDLLVKKDYGNEGGVIANFVGKGDAMISARALNENSPENYEYSVKDSSKMAKSSRTSSLSSIEKKYLQNEDENRHSENVVLLAKNFGDADDLKLAKEILRKHNAEGGLSSENGKKRQDLHLKLIDIARKEFAKEGIQFAKGGEIAKGNYEMMLSQAKEVQHHAKELQDILKKEKEIEAWVVAKMENVSSTLSDITHYLDGKTEYAYGGKTKMAKGGTMKQIKRSSC
jgi:hypothetical protein